MSRLALLILALLAALPAAPAQPHQAAHPGSDTYRFAAVRHQQQGAGGFGLVYYLPQPSGANAAHGPYPVLLFGHGKSLYGGSLLAQHQPLDYFYAALLLHLARKGYVVAFPQMEAGLFDGDRRAQAGRFLAALRWLGRHVPAADTRRVIFAGHSMGADVALLAATLVGHGAFADLARPPAVLALAPVDEPIVSTSLDGLPSGSSVTFVTGDRDTIAPPAGVVRLASAIHARRTQVVELTSDDAVAPPLIADHNLSLTAGNLPAPFGGAARLDALDWYGVWKLGAGLLDYTFRHGDPTWIWGAQRLDGGVDGGGNRLRYRLLR